MATIRLTLSLPSSFKTSSLASLPFRPSLQFHHSKLSRQNIPILSSSSSFTDRKLFRLVALVNEESVVTVDYENDREVDILGLPLRKQSRPCELYVCNLPRSLDIADLLEMFKPFGTVISVEVSKNPETGISKGCGFVTMCSINSAKKAVSALDGIDVEGREMRVKFSVDMNAVGSRRNPVTLNSAPVKNIIYESPFKVYIGNLAWNVTPEELRIEFSKFGNIVSARVLSDRRNGKNRAYAFLSFSSAEERDAALSFDGQGFHGRTLVVRKGLEREE